MTPEVEFQATACFRHALMKTYPFACVLIVAIQVAACTLIKVDGQAPDSLGHGDEKAVLSLHGWQAKDRSSWVGIRGSEVLGDGLRTIYRIEFDGDKRTNR